MKLIICFLASFVFLFNHYSVVYGQVSSAQSVSATVKVSICGDNLQEGGEDCDNTDLGGKTCATLGTGYNNGLGYTGGTLACDIACDFNTLGCAYTATITQDEEDDADTISTTTATDTITTTTISVPSPIVREPPEQEVPKLISFLRPFDIDGDGELKLSEMAGSVRKWVDDWRVDIVEEVSLAQGFITGKTAETDCDLNGDSRCDLVDFSILMYNINSS